MQNSFNSVKSDFQLKLICLCCKDPLWDNQYFSWNCTFFTFIYNKTFLAPCAVFFQHWSYFLLKVHKFRWWFQIYRQITFGCSARENSVSLAEPPTKVWKVNSYLSSTTAWVPSLSSLLFRLRFAPWFLPNPQRHRLTHNLSGKMGNTNGLVLL